MTLPYNFLSGEIAKSAQVNANFQYLMDLIGNASTPGAINPQGALILGPRKTAMLSAEHDAGGYETDFFQISWNAQWKKVGGTFKYTRVLANVGGTSVRFGIRGLEVFATNQRTGDINTQLKSIFRVAHEDAGKLMYIPNDVRISNTNSVPTKSSQRRLMTVLLDDPIRIYGMQAVGKGVSLLDAYSYGIPRDASAIIVNAHVTAASGSGAGMLFIKKNGPTLDHSHNYMGMVAHATITGTGMGMRTGNQGVVPLGTGSYAGQFYILRTERFELANVYIIGYLV